jgi:diacylglycerol O-acyltransferase
VKRLNGWDAMLLYSQTSNVHTHTLKIGVIDASDFDGDFTFELFRRTLRRRLHLLEPLRYKLVDIPWKLHHPMWMEKAEIDLSYHLRRVRVGLPGRRRELDELIGEIASTPLDLSRPLWQMYFVEGMADHRFAVIGKVHRALADGVASATMMAKAMDLEDPIQDERDLYATNAPPSTGELLKVAWQDHVRQFRELPRLTRETAAGIGRVRKRGKQRGKHPEMAKAFVPPPTFINHVVSPGRRFATTTLALSDVKQTSKHLGITINDVVLATAAGALRELLLRYDGHADAGLIASVPATLNTSPDRLTGNEFLGTSVLLPVHVDDPMERVRLTALAAATAKEDFHLLGPEVVSRWAAYLPPGPAHAAFRWLSERQAQSRLLNVPISIVAGPRERGRIGGAVVSEIYSVGTLIAGSGLNITAWSYVDQLNISVLTDDLTLDDPHEATDAMMHAFTEIRSASGLSGELTPVHTAMAPARVS